MNTVHKKDSNRPTLSANIIHLLLSLALTVVLQSCYSSTAVMGTPVNQLALKGGDAASRRALKESEIKEIARMSRTEENQVFLEIDGVPEYKIGPGDELEINSHVGEKLTKATVIVSDSGKISYSFIDDMNVTGLTPSQLDDKLTKALSHYIKNPRIDVLVKDFKSKSALILGEVSSIRGSTYAGKAASGKIYLTGKTTLIDLLAMAGGYTVDADIKNVKLIRGGKSWIINLYDIIEKGDERLNVVIDQGDVVDVPELPQYGERVYVMGEVNKQGVYSLKDAQDLLAAISLADSFTSLAKEENTLIVREYEPGKKPLVMMADLNALLRKADLSQNIRLKDGDLVYVPRMLIGDINDWITNIQPMLNLFLYPEEFESKYFLRKYLHFDRRH